MMKNILPILLCTVLLALNFLVWRMGTVFLYSPPRQSTPPNPELSLMRTSDDIARGILAIEMELNTKQRKELAPLFKKGFQLREKLSTLQNQYLNQQEKILQLGLEQR